MPVPGWAPFLLCGFVQKKNPGDTPKLDRYELNFPSLVHLKRQ